MNTPLVIWWVGDGKPGHENQSLGLAEAIERQIPCSIHRISIAGKMGVLKRLSTATTASRDLPKPDLIIGAGHATHPALCWLAHQHHAKSLVLMKPSIPVGWFDFCIAPSHDFPKGASSPNVMLTRGALNRVTVGDGAKTGKLILVGGPSKTHGWDELGLLEMLAKATDRGGWELTDSRRTPEGFLDRARERLPGVTVFSHLETPSGWVPEKLQQAKEVWVTEDSVSMIYEALTSGARVGLLPVPRLRQKFRVLEGIDGLVADHFLTPYEAWLETGSIALPPEVLREADRCAVKVLEKTLV